VSLVVRGAHVACRPSSFQNGCVHSSGQRLRRGRRWVLQGACMHSLRMQNKCDIYIQSHAASFAGDSTTLVAVPEQLYIIYPCRIWGSRFIPHLNRICRVNARITDFFTF
jgi:hypothetical protein